MFLISLALYLFRALTTDADAREEAWRDVRVSLLFVVVTVVVIVVGVGIFGIIGLI